MSDSRVNARPHRWGLAAASLFVLYACGGTVVERSGPGGSGGLGGDGGGTSVAGTGGVGAGGIGGSVGTGGKIGTGGKVGAGGGIGTGGKVGTGGGVGTGGKVGTGGGTFGCAPPYVQCGTGCVDLQSNQASCGSCFNGCPADSKCVNGSCQKPPPLCLPNETYCSNWARCLDLSTNPFTCGSCLTGCGNGERCINGACAPGTCVISSQTYCPSSGRCVDFSSDYSNCGACDHMCGPGESCMAGKCVPPDCFGQTYCPGLGCVDTASDISNCGACGKACTQGATFDYGAYACNSGTCGCSPTANSCGKGCATNFWYCPPGGSTTAPADFCAQTARNNYERCACKGCLAEVQACFGSPTCVNAMDCTLNGICPSCQPVFSSCGDQNGITDPLADKLIACMNAQCQSP